MSAGGLIQLLNDDLAEITHRHRAQKFLWPSLNKLGITAWIKRDDLLDPYVSGNKLYKLWGHLQHIKANHSKTLLSFGGAYSNHLHALAAVGEALSIKTIGVIRGQRPPQLSATLKDCESMGMSLWFVTRDEYRQKDQSPRVQSFLSDHPDVYVIPEGGGGEAGSHYCNTLMSTIEATTPTGSTVCLPCGTATTFAGLLNAATGTHELLGFSALKSSPKDVVSGRPKMIEEVEQACSSSLRKYATSWDIRLDCHRGGYAKVDRELSEFIIRFNEDTGIVLDPVYTGKMAMATESLAHSGYWKEGSHVVLLHTGGLQGLRGYPSLKGLYQPRFNVNNPSSEARVTQSKTDKSSIN